MELSPEQIVASIGIFLAVWYLLAAIFNRRRGIAVYYWLKSDLDRLGGEVSGRWIGSSGSGAQLKVNKAVPPFKTIEIIYLLASRELLPLFLFDLARGKRDRLIVKAEVRRPIPSELEAVPPRGELAHQMRSERNQPWDVTDGPHNLLVGTRGKEGDDLREALKPFLEDYGPRVERVSWSRKSPHLIVVLSLSGLYVKGESAGAIYTDLATMASTASRKAQGGQSDEP